MKHFRYLVLGVVALTGLVLATSAKADDRAKHSYTFHSQPYSHGTPYYGPTYFRHHHFFYYRGGENWSYSVPYYTWDPYNSFPVPVYGYQPGVSIAFGGSPR